jgi:protease I
MERTLAGRKIAILLTDGFEQVEMTEPRKALEEAGATAHLVSPKQDEVQAWKHFEKGDKFHVDARLQSAQADDYDALMLPDGVANPDQLRMIPEAIHFVQAFANAHKPIAAICHGPWMLVEAGAVKGRAITSWPSLKTDIRNAGGDWQDREVIADNGVVTSRKPSDIPAFNTAMIKEFGAPTRAVDRD